MPRIRPAGLALAITVVLASASRARAQARVTLDLGGAALRQEGISGGVALGAVDLRLRGVHHAFLGSGLVALDADAGGSAQAVVTGMLFAPASHLFRWELSASASTFGQSGDVPVFGAEVFGREYVGRSRGLFIGLGGGPSISGGVSWPTGTGEVGGWWRVGRDQFTASASGTKTTVGLVTTYSNGAVVQSNHRIGINDAALAWRGQHGPATLSMSAGVRAWLGRREAWATASVEGRVNSRFSVVGAIGRALEDVARGIPATRYASIALRVNLLPASRAAPVPIASTTRFGGPTLSVSREDDDRALLVVSAPGATRVELMADFTNWDVVMLDEQDGVWRLSRDIEPGPHRVAIRIDGGDWRVPANLPIVGGDLGMQVGLITVP